MSIPNFFSILLLLLSLMVSHGAKDTENSMPGGYSVVQNLGDDRVMRAVHFAVANLSTSPYDFSHDPVSSHLISGYQQVVAGMNYKFEIVLTEQNNDNVVLGGFRVDVYDQFGVLSIKRWGPEINQSEAAFMLKRSREDSEAN